MWAGLTTKIIGGRVEPRLRVLYASVGADFAAITVFVMYFGPWLIKERHASAGFISAAFVVAGIGGMLGGVVGGRRSDRHGRRPLALTGATVQFIASAVMLLPVSTTVAALLLGVIVAAQPVRGVAQRALLADQLDAATREKGFADYRLALNLGLFGGPLVASALVLRGWWPIYLGACVLFGLSLWWAWRPADTPYPIPAGVTAPARLGWRVVRNPRLVLLFCASTLAWTTINGYEILLPTILIGGDLVSPQQWGAIYALGPALIIVFQLRMQRWMSGVATRGSLLVGMLTMGAAFLLLVIEASAAMAILVTVVFLCGDMMWGPASEDAVVRVAPADQRGMYMGAMAASIWLGSALAPAIGLQVQQSWGNAPVWVILASTAAISGLLYASTAGTAKLMTSA